MSETIEESLFKSKYMGQVSSSKPKILRYAQNDK